MAQIYATFPGVSNIKRVRAPRTLGPYPSAIEVEFQPQESLTTLSGNLVVSDGTDSHTFYGCVIDTASLRISIYGHLERAVLWDRRRLWRFTTFTGVYNERDSSGAIIAATEKTPQQLAALFLDAMGETGYDVSDLPNSDRPFINMSCDRPDLALHRLCVDNGCDFGIMNDNAVDIVVVGTGSALPADTDVQTVSFGADNGEVPETIRVCCGPTQYRYKILLEAVGLGLDGTVVPIDELSYAPSGGWGSVDPLDPLVDSEYPISSALASQSVYRWYRVKWLMTSVDGATPVDPEVIFLPGVGTLGDISDILPVSRSGATVTGRFVSDRNQIENSPFGAEVDVPFTVDEENGIVKFTRPVYRHAVGEEDVSLIYPAYLMLEAWFSIRSPVNFQYVHYERDYSAGGDTGVHVIKRDDLVRTVAGNYDTTDITVLDSGTPATDNATAINALADTAITAVLPEFATYTSHEVRYKDIKSSIDLDGAIRQLMYIVNDNEDGRGGAFTFASRNCEPILGLMRRREMTYRAANESHSPVGQRQLREFRRTRRRT